jgi:hypothetical protein
MSLALETMRGRALKARLAVNGIQKPSRSLGIVVAAALLADMAFSLRDIGTCIIRFRG